MSGKDEKSKANDGHVFIRLPYNEIRQPKVGRIYVYDEDENVAYPSLLVVDELDELARRHEHYSKDVTDYVAKTNSVVSVSLEGQLGVSSSLSSSSSSAATSASLCAPSSSPLAMAAVNGSAALQACHIFTGENQIVVTAKKSHVKYVKLPKRLDDLKGWIWNKIKKHEKDYFTFWSCWWKKFGVCTGLVYGEDVRCCRGSKGSYVTSSGVNLNAEVLHNLYARANLTFDAKSSTEASIEYKDEKGYRIIGVQLLMFSVKPVSKVPDIQLGEEDARVRMDLFEGYKEPRPVAKDPHFDVPLQINVDLGTILTHSRSDHDGDENAMSN